MSSAAECLSDRVAVGEAGPRIAIVVRWPVGGIRTWLRYVYSNPLFRAYRLTALVSASSETRALKEDLEGLGIEVIEGESSSRRFAIEVSRFLQARRWDLVHSHGFAAAAMATPVVWLRGYKHIVTQHDVLLDEQFRDLQGRLVRRFLGLALKRATIIHSVSHSAKTNLVENFPRLAQNDLRVIVNGINPDTFWAAKPADIRSDLDIPANAFLIGFFGRFMAQKGFKYLVEAVDSLRHKVPSGRQPIVLAVGGGGFRAREERWLRQLGIDEHFRFVDFTPDVAGLLKAVDVVVMPSLWEACGILAMEALAAGTPLICSDCPALKEITSGKPVRIVPTKDAAALENALLSEYAQPSKVTTQRWAEGSRSAFSVEHTASGVGELYRSLTEAKGIE